MNFIVKLVTTDFTRILLSKIDPNTFLKSILNHVAPDYFKVEIKV